MCSRWPYLISIIAPLLFSCKSSCVTSSADSTEDVRRVEHVAEECLLQTKRYTENLGFDGVHAIRDDEYHGSQSTSTGSVQFLSFFTFCQSRFFDIAPRLALLQDPLSDDSLAVIMALAVMLCLVALASLSSCSGEQSAERDASLGLFACVASFPCFIDGMNFSIASGVLYQLDANSRWSILTRAAIVGGLQMGQVVSAAVVPRLIDAQGSKQALVVVSVGQLLALALMAMCPRSVAAIILGRIASGIFFGQMVAPVLIAEHAPPSERGFAVSFVEMLTNLGSMAGFVFHVLLHTKGLQHIWLSAVCASLVSTSAVACLASRRYLSTASPEARLNFTVNDNTAKLSWLGMLQSSSGVCIASMLGFLQQSTGEEVLYGFTTQLAKDSGLAKPLRFGLILASVTFAGNIAASFSMDRYGRRPLLIGGMLAMAISWMAAAITLNSNMGPHTVLACILLYEVFFALSLGPSFFVVASEVMPLSLRTRGLAFALFVSRVTACVMVLTFEFKNWIFRLEGTFVVYALLMLLGAFYIYKKLPETKGRRLEEIQVDFADKHGC